MLNFTYHLPTKIYFGKNQLQELPTAIKTQGATKILLVYGGGSIKKIGLYDAVIKLLKEHGIEYIELANIPPNPRITNVYEGEELCRKHSVDLIIGVGGGSSIDAAKAIAIGAVYDGDTWELFKNPEKITASLPVMTVLTLAATGSEMNHVSVITNEQTREKIGTRAPIMRPIASFMDPQYTFSVNRYYTAAGVADIMAHTFENYFSRHKGGYLQDRMAEAILKTCIKYGPIVHADPENYEARANLMWAGTWAINGLINLGKADPWTCHSIVHQIGAHHDVTHGAALAILHPHWMEYVLNAHTVDKFYEYGVNIWDLDGTANKYTVARRAIEKTRAFYNSLDLPATLSELGVTKEKFDTIAEVAATLVVREQAYVPLQKEDILKILNNMG